MVDDALRTLADRLGVATGYWDWRGRHVDVPAATVVAGDGIRIVPGVSRSADGRGDVMRGEEVQLFGAIAAGLAPGDALLCQPGTHCKWAWMAAGAIADFTTAMTGELFSLLKAHSLIGADMAAGDVADGVRGGSLGPKELCELVVEFLGGRLGLEIPSIPFADGLLYVTTGSDSAGWLPMPPLGRSVSGGLFVDSARP